MAGAVGAGRRRLAAGVVGSALVALGGTGAGALPASGWDLLAAWPGAALVLCWAGVVLLAASWWSSRGLGLAHQRTACVLWTLPLLAAPPLLSRDLYAYAGQAALVVAGRDPYTEGPGALPGPLSAGVDGVWLDAPAPYGPVWLVLAGLVVRLTGGSLVGALLGLRLLAVAGVALAAWALLRLTRGDGPAASARAAPQDRDGRARGRAARADPEDAVRARALWLGVANPLVLLHLVAGGHNDALMIGLLATGVAVAATVRGPAALVGAAVLVTLAALVKVPAALALPFLPLLVAHGRGPRLRAAAWTAGTAAATAVAVSLTSGLGWGWLSTLGTGRARLSLLSPLTGVGVAVGALDAVLAAGLLAAAVGCLVLLVRADRLGPLRALGLALLTTSVLLPVVQPWYLLWGVVLLAAVAGPRAATALGAGCLVLCLAIAPSGRHVVRPPLYGAPTLFAGAVALLVLRTTGDAGPSVGGPPDSGPSRTRRGALDPSER